MVTTQWSQVLAARDGSDTKARRALEALYKTYWEPLYAYIRHHGSSPDEASDLTQAYFTELLAKDFLASVDPSKGRFRSFLFSSLKHFLSHERERVRAQKRGADANGFARRRGRGAALWVAAGHRDDAGGGLRVSLGRYDSEPSDGSTPAGLGRFWQRGAVRRAQTVLDKSAIRGAVPADGWCFGPGTCAGSWGYIKTMK